MGHTGYSTTENVNNIKIVHLHWGLQLIFDEHMQAAVKSKGTKEWVRTVDIEDPKVEEYEAGNSEKANMSVKENS